MLTNWRTIVFSLFTVLAVPQLSFAIPNNTSNISVAMQITATTPLDSRFNSFAVKQQNVEAQGEIKSVKKLVRLSRYTNKSRVLILGGSEALPM